MLLHVFQDFANRFNGKIKSISKARGNVVANSLGYSNKISDYKAQFERIIKHNININKCKLHV